MTKKQIKDLLSAFTDSNEASGWADTAIAACLKTGIIAERTCLTL